MRALADNAMYPLLFQPSLIHGIYFLLQLARIHPRYVPNLTGRSIGMKPLLASKLLDWWDSSGERLLSRGAVFLLCLAAAFLCWSLIPRASAGGSRSEAVAPPPQTSRLRATVASPPSAHLFGAAAAIQDIPAASAADVHIDGIVYTGDAGSLALIAVGGVADAKAYGIGQRLPDGEAVAAIESAAVVLRQGSISRRLELDTQYADADAHFITLGADGVAAGAWADAYTQGNAAENRTRSAARAVRAGIAIVPGVAPQSARALPLSEIRAERSKRFAGLRGAPLSPAPAPGPNK